MCTWPLSVLGPCHNKTAPCIAINQLYVNPTMLFDPRHHVTQCSITPPPEPQCMCTWHVASEPCHSKRALCIAINQQYVNQPCCLVTGIMLHNAAWWLNSQTTYFHHTASIAAVHVHMAAGCSGTLSQQTSSLPCDFLPTMCESYHAD
jgi:hypothetical protein